ncbi:MAG: tRNA (adenosine(37)-N6)-threonylcarbamoyltransferase complex dimerization subunit type 1 TsaB [Gemmatimonadales bacterium]
MITLAFDTASDRCTVAATDGSHLAHRHLDGSRQHAKAILSLLDEVLGELDATPREVTQLLTGDGPGSFTGLRVASTVAKALAWRRSVTWRTAPSLLIRAAAHTTAGGSTVLSLSDALRGDLYAGCWRIGADGVVARGPSPRAVAPGQLTELFGVVDVVVGTVPDALVDAIAATTNREMIRGEMALPDARTLLALGELEGGTTTVTDSAGWEPVYGRPAEAQAVWERTHGRPMPPAPGLIR